MRTQTKRQSMYWAMGWMLALALLAQTALAQEGTQPGDGGGTSGGGHTEELEVSWTVYSVTQRAEWVIKQGRGSQYLRKMHEIGARTDWIPPAALPDLPPIHEGEVPPALRNQWRDGHPSIDINAPKWSSTPWGTERDVLVIHELLQLAHKEDPEFDADHKYSIPVTAEIADAPMPTVDLSKDGTRDDHAVCFTPGPSEKEIERVKAKVPPQYQNDEGLKSGYISFATRKLRETAFNERALRFILTALHRASLFFKADPRLSMTELDGPTPEDPSRPRRILVVETEILAPSTGVLVPDFPYSSPYKTTSFLNQNSARTLQGDFIYRVEGTAPARFTEREDTILADGTKTTVYRPETPLSEVSWSGFLQCDSRSHKLAILNLEWLPGYGVFVPGVDTTEP